MFYNRFVEKKFQNVSKNKKNVEICKNIIAFFNVEQQKFTPLFTLTEHYFSLLFPRVLKE